MVAKEIIANFAHTTEQIFSLKELESMLNSGTNLRIKYGVDVTSSYLHIGHAVNLWMMRQLQDYGHKVIFLIGDATTRIGDPTGKNKTRPVIELKTIEENTEQFIEQAKMVLRFDDPNLIEIRRNSEWFDSMVAPEFLKLMSMVTHSRLISRDMFKRRIEQKDDIYMHELIYPILQGYDSVMIASDITIVGSDQLYNEMMGRFFQEKLGQRQQVIITTKVTPGIDGVLKQSKSLDNYIGLKHSPRDKFGRVMKIPDSLIGVYLEVYTDFSGLELKKMAELISVNPMEAKKSLATNIVRRYHGDLVAEKERKWFEDTFSNRQVPDDIPEIILPSQEMQALDILSIFFGDDKSKGEIRRLFRQGGVSLNGEKLTDPNKKLLFSEGDFFRVGKRVWFQIKLS